MDVFSSAHLIESELGAGWVTRADVREDGVADTSHVRALCEIISSATGPHKHVVSEVAHDAVSVLFLVVGVGGEI